MEQDLEFTDFGDFSYRLSRKHRYEDTKETFYFLSEDSNEDEIELCTDVEFVYRVIPAKSQFQAETDLEVSDQYELIAWSVGGTTEYTSGDVVDPRKVLTQEEFQRYTADLESFISSFE